MAVAAVQSSTSVPVLGFSILPKDTWTCRPGESHQQPSDNKMLALPLSHSRPCQPLMSTNWYICIGQALHRIQSLANKLCLPCILCFILSCGEPSPILACKTPSALRVPLLYPELSMKRLFHVNLNVKKKKKTLLNQIKPSFTLASRYLLTPKSTKHSR